MIILVLFTGKSIIMKKNICIIISCCFLVLFVSCKGIYQTDNDFYTTETETERVIDEEYGEGMSFSFVDFADDVLSLKYNLIKDNNGNWRLSVSGENSLVKGNVYIEPSVVDAFFYYLVNESGITAYDDYNKKDEYITTDVIWWFDIKAAYANDDISLYGYMMHPTDYDALRVSLTEYLNNMFINAKDNNQNNNTETRTIVDNTVNNDKNGE